MRALRTSGVSRESGDSDEIIGDSNHYLRGGGQQRTAKPLPDPDFDLRFRYKTSDTAADVTHGYCAQAFADQLQQVAFV